MSDHLQALFDRIAVQDEHSHVPYDARRTIAEVILRTDHLDVLESAIWCWVAETGLKADLPTYTLRLVADAKGKRPIVMWSPDRAIASCGRFGPRWCAA